MKYELIKLEELSGTKASVYTIQVEGQEHNLLENFVEENYLEYSEEVDEILTKIDDIGHRLGAREHFFKLKEGRPGDHVAALYDNPDKNLRLYCIRQGSCLIILGGGGPKPKDIRALQEDDNLKRTNAFMRKVSDDIYERMKDDEIWYSNDYFDLEGNLEFDE